MAAARHDRAARQFSSSNAPMASAPSRSAGRSPGGRSRGRRHAAARGRQDPGGRARARADVQPRRGDRGDVPGHRPVGRPGRRRDRARAAAAGQPRGVRPPLPVRRRRRPAGSAGRRTPRCSARELPGAYDELRRDRRRAAGHQLLRRPAGSHRDRHRRTRPPPRPGRPGRASLRAGHRRPASDHPTGALLPGALHRVPRQRRRPRPVPGDARRGGRIGPAHRRNSWTTAGPGASAVALPAAGDRPGLGRVATRRGARLGGTRRRRPDPPRPAAAGARSGTGGVRRRRPRPERIHRHPDHRGQLLADRRGLARADGGVMPLWFTAGLRRGMVTTRYPASRPLGRAPAHAARASGRGTDPRLVDRLMRGLPGRRAAPGRPTRWSSTLGACTACGRCLWSAPARSRRAASSSSPPPTVPALVKRVPSADHAGMRC